MTDHYPLYLERRDPTRNLARFYLLELETDLLGELVAIRRWGRIGSVGRQITIPCATEHAAMTALTQMETAKRRRGTASAKGIGKRRGDRWSISSITHLRRANPLPPQTPFKEVTGE